MIGHSGQLASAMTRSYVFGVRVESWYAGQLLAADVPVDGGSEEVDRSLRVPERVTFTVPRVDRGARWDPADVEDHPLAANGQRVRITLGVDVGGRQEWLERGWFLIDSAEPRGDQVDVVATGLLQLIAEADLITPYQPTGTMLSTLRALVEPALTVVLAPDMVDRPVPAGTNYDQDRLAAVMELLDAWGADARVVAAGYLHVFPSPAPPVPVLSLTNGVGGTVIDATGTSTREGATNVVVARGTASDGSQVQGVAYDQLGPKRYGGPFNPLPVPEFFTSPLLTSPVQCLLAARTVLERRRRTTAQEYRVEMVPHLALQAGDVVTVTTETLAGVPATVEHLTLPYVADGGASTLRVRRAA